jgi:uncharacterized membrane protein
MNDPLTIGVTRAQKSLTGLLVHGFFILLPVLLVGWMATKVFLALQGVIRPMLDAMPGLILRHRYLRLLASCVAVAALLLLVGLLAQTRAGQAVGRWLETKILNRVPFYPLLRNLASSLAGRDDASALKPVLVTVDDPGLQQLGFILERHPDGNVTVFLPSSPSTGSGTVVIVNPPRIRELHIPGRQVMKCLGRWGDGAAALLQKAGNALPPENGSDELTTTRMACCWTSRFRALSPA